MSKGLRTSAALGSIMIGFFAMNAGAIAQTAGNDGNAAGKPVATWNFENGSQDVLTWNLPGERREADREVITQGRNHPTSYTAQPQAKPRNGARSGN